MLKMKQVIDDLLSGKKHREPALKDRRELSAVSDPDKSGSKPENNNIPYGNNVRGH
jgi:hypothetical protein